MKETNNKQTLLTLTEKWYKRLVLSVVLLYIFVTFIIKVDVKQRIMFRMTNKSSSIKELQIFMRSYSSLKEIRNTFQSGTSDERKLETKDFIEENQTISNSTERLVVDLSHVNLTTIESLLGNSVSRGGSFTPTNRKTDQKIALIIPYRDREQHLKIFLRHMHPFLQRQNLDYRVFVIEMDNGTAFNRAILMNIGFVEAMKVNNFTCFIFHDVDLLPESDLIPYSCTNMPRHLSVAVDKFKYRLPYTTIFGGASSIQADQFRKVNGMSNMFFGWGGEDDDFSKRIRLNNFKIIRPSNDIARYKMILHKQDTNRNNQRMCLLKSTGQRMKTDGLSSLKYSVKKIDFQPLYTTVLVRINKKELLSSDKNLFNIYKSCEKKK